MAIRLLVFGRRKRGVKMGKIDDIVYGIIHTHDIFLIQQAVCRSKSCIITDKDLSSVLNDDLCREYNIDILTSSFDSDIARGKRYHNIYILSDINFSSDNISMLLSGALAIRSDNFNSDNFQIIINTKRI